MSTPHRDENEKGFPKDSDSGSKASEISGIDRHDNDLETVGYHHRYPEQHTSWILSFAASNNTTQLC